MFGKNEKKKKETKKQERKLTKAELRRKEEFEKLKEQYQSKGYEEKDLTISVLYANIMAFVLGIPVILVMLVLYIVLNDGQTFSVVLSGSDYLIFLVAFIASIVIHELIHGVSWAAFAKNHFKDIEFGFIAEYLTPYCCCKTTLKKYQYVIGAIMPTIVLGILPCVIASFISSGVLFYFGAFMILGGGGDMTILLKLFSYRSAKKEKLYIDHPYECGMVVFEK